MSRNFEFCDKNLLNTTTMIGCSSGTGTFAYLFDRNVDIDFQTDGHTANTSTVLTINLDAPTVISRVMLQGHNLKDYRVFYDGVTANSWAAVTGNSNTSTLLTPASTTVSSISIQMDNVIETGKERTIGELIVTDCRVTLDNNPDTGNFTPKFFGKKIRHEMPDGGTSLFVVANKYRAKMKLRFVSDSVTTQLLELYNDGDAFYFVPEGTTGAWAGEAREVVWVNDWEFLYGDNAKSQGQNGGIEIEETPGA
jgi:ankyrin repeat protein